MHCVTSPSLLDLSTQSDKFGTKKYLFFFSNKQVLRVEITQKNLERIT